jgi:hypothetical protein
VLRNRLITSNRPGRKRTNFRLVAQPETRFCRWAGTVCPRNAKLPITSWQRTTMQWKATSRLLNRDADASVLTEVLPKIKKKVGP